MYNPLEDSLTIADKTFTSRLLIGSARYPNNQVMIDSIAASGAQIVTVAIRRVDLSAGGETVLDLLEGDYHILPNTAPEWADIKTAHNLFEMYRLPREMGTVLLI